MNSAERIKIFNKIRDIPYSVSDDIDNTKGYCSCATKAVMIEKELGLPTRFIICDFNWEDLDLPSSLLAIPHESPAQHMYAEVQIPESGGWVVVDPTWDPGLKDLVEINEWDGLTSTSVAVKAIKTYTPEESKKLLEKYSTQEHIKRYFKDNKEFLAHLNQVIEEIRS